MHTDVGHASDEDMDQEAVGALFAQHDFLALPVVDADGRMKGIVTVDDIVDVVQEEATEDAQKFGGMEALDAPYLQTRFWRMIKKRAGWLVDPVRRRDAHRERHGAASRTRSRGRSCWRCSCR